MKLLFRSDTRRSHGRQSETKQDSANERGRRQAKRRQIERRKGFRVVYPLTAAPKVLNANLRVVDISQGGIKLACKDHREECCQPITLGSVLELKIQFHDGEILDIKVKIIRCESNNSSHENSYAGPIQQGISSARIAKEQTYLLRHFPEYFKASYEQSQENTLYLRDDSQ